MLYIKKNNDTQTAFIPKNGSYEGKLSYKEGYEVGKAEGIEEGKNNPYSTKGFFFENGEKEYIYPVRIDRDTMLQISFLGGNTSDYVEISFYPMGNGCVLANRNDSDIVCAMRGDFLRVLIYNTLQFELPCKQREWHTLRLYTDRVILDGEETYFNTPYTGSSVVCACVNRGGNGFYRGLIQYMKGVEGEAVMYYISNLDEGGFKRLRSDNGVSDWYENNFVPVWGAFPVLQDKVPLNSVFINVEGGNCPELTELNVSENGRYEGAYNVVNVDVPDVNGSYDEGYNNGYNDGKAEGGSCNIEETRWAEPTPADVDGSGYLVYHKSEGYDGMDRVALNMNGYNALKYNEGYEAGKAEGGSCNLTELNIEWQSDWNENDYYADKQDYDGYSYVHIDATTALKEKYDEGYDMATASLTELNVTENGTYEGAYNKVNVDVPTIQNPIEEYYYCPLIIEDANSGEYAKTWGEDNVTFNNYDGDVIEDVIYLPTSTNINEFRTKEKARFVQHISVPDNQIKSIEFGEFVEFYIWLGEGHNYTNLTKIVLGANMDTLNFGASDILPALNEIWDYSNTEEFEVYFPLNNVGSGGTVYLKNKDHESEWRNSLPEDWTIKYIDEPLTPSVVEKEYNTIALRTENIYDGDIIRDKSKLLDDSGESAEGYFITYTQNKNSVVICSQNKYTAPHVTTIENNALDWNKIKYFYSFTINTFGVNMTRDAFSNVRGLYITNDWMNTITFKTGCFATSNILNKIVFYAPYDVVVEENAFEGVSSNGNVIVVGEDNAENRAKYDTLMAQLGDGWTLRFVNEYNE